MTPIDLRPFADHSTKIPSKALIPAKIKSANTIWKVMSSHYLDFIMITNMTFMMMMMFEFSFGNLMVTNGLRSAFEQSSASSVGVFLFPVVMFGYFFFSYFMNDGQTWGMHRMKRRIDMESKSFTQALKWAAHSFAFCFTGGLIYLIRRNEWKNLKAHDHRYQDLIVFKEIAPIDLLSKIDEFELQKSTEKKEEEYYQEAA